MSLFGNVSIQLLATSRQWSASGGWRTVRRWRGLKADLEGQLGLSMADGVTINYIEEPGAFAILELGTPDYVGSPESTTEPVSVDWSLDSELMDKSIFDYPGLDESQAVAVKNALDEVFAGNQAVSFYSGGFGSALANRIFLLGCKGVDTWRVTTYVLTREVVLAPGFADKWPITNVGKKYTTADLITAENVPEDIKFSLPETGEWLKYAPDIRTNRARKTSVTNQWVYADKWEDELYPAAT